MIATNIANISTSGYKKSEASFFDLVTTGLNTTRYSPGSVNTTRILRAGAQGQIQQTSSAMDAAITGNGFFTVKADTDPTAEFMYTRAGSFNPDNLGILRNENNLALYAWPYDTDGNLPTTLNSFSSLAAADVSVFDTAFQPTTLVNEALNLNAQEHSIDPHTMPGGPGTLPVSVQSTNGVTDPSQPVDFAQTITIVDNTGATRDITMEFRKIIGPMAHFTTNTLDALSATDAFIPTSGISPTPGINVGDRFRIQVSSGATETYTFVNEVTGDNPATNQIATVKGFIDAINAHGIGSDLRASLTDDGRLLVRSAAPGSILTVTNVSGGSVSLPGTLDLIRDPGTNSLTYSPEASVSSGSLAYPDQGDFPALTNAGTPDVFTWWEMRVMAPADPSITDPASPGYNPADPMFNQKIELRKGLINFNGDGTLNATPDATGNILIDLSTNPANFDSTLSGEETAFNIDISGLMQFSGKYTAVRSQQNGIASGQRTNVQISNDGDIQGVFTNGIIRNLYKIPLATFVNPEGLNDISGTAFRETEGSGTATLEEPGTGAAGYVTPSEIESSNVDLGDEFAKLIVSQRAFGASSQIIKASNEMISLLAQLRN